MTNKMSLATAPLWRTLPPTAPIPQSGGTRTTPAREKCVGPHADGARHVLAGSSAAAGVFCVYAAVGQSDRQTNRYRPIAMNRATYCASI